MFIFGADSAKSQAVSTIRLWLVMKKVVLQRCQSLEMSVNRQLFKFKCNGKKLMSSHGGLRELFFAFDDEHGNSQLVKAFDWQLLLEQTPVFVFVELRKITSSREEYFLQNAQYSPRISDLFNSGTSYQLEILRIQRKSLKPYLIALDLQRNQYKIFIKNWESRSLGIGELVWCEISYLNNDIDAVQFELVQILQYPFFQFGRKYRFEIQDEKDQKNYCTVKDDFGCFHNVEMTVHLKRQLVLAEGGETDLYYLGVLPNHDLNLRFFRSFQDIIPFKSLRKKVFDPILLLSEDKKGDPRVAKIQEEYREFRNYWVLTFGQYLSDELPKYYDSGNLADARLYAEVAFLLEQWILKSGYQYSIVDDTVREKIVENTQERIAVLQNWLETIEYIQEDEEIEFIFNVIDKKHVSLDRSMKLLKILRFYIGRDRLAELETEEIYDKLYDALGPAKFKILYPSIQQVLKRHLGHLIEATGFDIPLFTSYERRKKYIANSGLRDLLRIQFQAFRFACMDNEDTAILEFIHFLNYLASYSSEKNRRSKFLSLAIQLSKGDRQLWRNVLNEIELHDFDAFESSVFAYSTKMLAERASSFYADDEVVALPRTEVNNIVLHGKHSEYYYFFDSREIRNGWYGSLQSKVIASDPLNKVLCLAEYKQEKSKSDSELTVGEFYDANIASVSDEQLQIDVEGRTGIIEKDDLSPVQVSDLSMVFSVGEALKVKLKEIRFDGEELTYIFDRQAYFDQEARVTDVVGEVYTATLCSISNKIGLFLEALGLPRILMRRDAINHRGIHLTKLFKVGDKIPIVVTQVEEDGCLVDFTAKEGFAKNIKFCSEEEAVLVELFSSEMDLDDLQLTYCANCTPNDEDLNLIGANSEWKCDVCQTTPSAFALMHVPSFNKFILHPLNSQQEYRSLIDKVYNSERFPVKCFANEKGFWCVVSMDKLALNLGSSQYALLGAIYESAAFETTVSNERKKRLRMSHFFYDLTKHEKTSFIKLYGSFIQWVEDFLQITSDYKLKTVQRLKAEVFLAGVKYIKLFHQQKEVFTSFPNLVFLKEVACAIQDWDVEISFSRSSNLASAFRSFYLLPKNYRSDAYQLEIVGVIREALIEFVGIQFQEAKKQS